MSNDDIDDRSYKKQLTEKQKKAVARKSLDESNFIKSLVLPQGYDEENFTNMRDDSEQASKITIKAHNPVVKDAMPQKYIIYDIEGEDERGTFHCKRRYSDFYE